MSSYNFHTLPGLLRGISSWIPTSNALLFFVSLSIIVSRVRNFEILSSLSSARICPVHSQRTRPFRKPQLMELSTGPHTLDTYVTHKPVNGSFKKELVGGNDLVFIYLHVQLKHEKVWIGNMRVPFHNPHPSKQRLVLRFVVDIRVVSDSSGACQGLYLDTHLHYQFQ